MRRRFTRSRSARCSDEGMVLPLVIVFVVVIGALVAAMLMQSQTNFKSTSVTRNHQEKVYAANSALEYATQLVRNDPTTCPNIGSSANLPDQSFGGRTVKIACAGTAGASDGPGGYGLFITGASGGGITTECQTFIIFTCADAPKRIVGPVYNGGTWNLSDTLTVQDGFAVKGTSGALTPCTAPSQLRFNPTGLNSYRCSAALAVPPPPWSLGELAPTLPAAAPAATNPGSGCRVFSPGRYTAVPSLISGQNYFRSGVYLLDNVNLAIGSGQILVGGRPNNDDATRVPLTGSCATAQSSDTGNGAVFLLAGNASITGFFASVEIYSYRPTVTVPLRSPISIYQLSATEVTAWGLTNPNVVHEPAFSIGDFAGFSNLVGVQVSLHGAVYVPRSGVDIWMTTQMAYPILGGVVARSFGLHVGLFSGTPSDVGVRAGNANQRRSVRLSISVLAKPGLTEKPILGTADIDISNDPAHSISVTSWRINEDTNLSTPTP